MNDEYSKVNMIDQIAISVSSPKNYVHLTKLKTGKTVAFMILIAFIMVFMEVGISFITFLVHVGGLDNLVNNKITPFVYEDGALSAENEMALDIGNTIIYINTDYEDVSLADMDTDGIYLAFGSKSMIMGIVSGTTVYEYMTMEYTDFVDLGVISDGFDNAALASMIPIFYISMALVYIFSMAGDIIEALIYALIFSIVARMMAKNLNTGLSYGNVLRVCIYGQTLGMLLTAANSCAGLVSSTIMYIIYFIISYMFITRGIGAHARNPEAPPDDWV